MQPLNKEHAYEKIIYTYARARSCDDSRNYAFYMYDLYAAARLQLLCCQHSQFATNWLVIFYRRWRNSATIHCELKYAYFRNAL